MRQDWAHWVMLFVVIVWATASVRFLLPMVGVALGSKRRGYSRRSKKGS